MSETRFTVQVDGIQETIQALLAVAPMFQGKKGYPGNPLRNAVRAGTVPIVELASAKAPVDATDPDDGTRLADNIDIRIVSTKERDAFTRAGDSLEAYDIGYKHKGPNRSAYGGFIELGTDKMPAQPYLRPALQEGATAAVSAMNEKLKVDLAKIKKKLGLG